MKEQEARRDKEGRFVERVRTRGYDAYDPLQRRTGMKEIEAKDQSQRQWIRERKGLPSLKQHSAYSHHECKDGCIILVLLRLNIPSK